MKKDSEAIIDKIFADKQLVSSAIVIKTNLSFSKFLETFKLKVGEHLLTTELQILPVADGGLNINEVRALKSMLSFKMVNERIILIQADKLLPITQNALLKTFEESYANTSLILYVPSQTVLLPTMLSRVQVIVLNDSQTEDFQNFELIDALEKYSTLESVRDYSNFFQQVMKYCSSKLSVLSDNVLAINKISKNIKNLLKTYQAWTGGYLITKYAYEMFCIELASINNVVNDKK